MDHVILESSWKKHLILEFSKPYMQELKKFLQLEQLANKVIYPKNSQIFEAFKLTPWDQVKVVIIGQDPYHGLNQAHGLCFSVLPKVALPRSLVNIYTELYQDLGIAPKTDGYLASWAKQGVLMLNSVLTVEQGLPGSHANKGWEKFTDQVILTLNSNRNKIIFLLWGQYALQKGKLIDSSKHIVLTAAHPSPLAANKGFFGCKHFSKTNVCLMEQGIDPINW